MDYDKHVLFHLINYTLGSVMFWELEKGVEQLSTAAPCKMHRGHAKCMGTAQNMRHFLHGSLAEAGPIM